MMIVIKRSKNLRPKRTRELHQVSLKLHQVSINLNIVLFLQKNLLQGLASLSYIDSLSFN